VPFALLGGVFGLWASGFPLSVSAAVGFIALIGQASLNGVLVLSAIAERRERGEPLDDASRRGARAAQTGADDRWPGSARTGPAALSPGHRKRDPAPLAVVIVAGTLSHVRSRCFCFR
jgi:cobalt-zinc-cadmium resistance protein CzcA